MEINKFVENTIIEICTGISKAKEHKINKNGVIAPGYLGPPIHTNKVAKIREIEFDLNIIVSKENLLEVGGNAKIGVKMLAGADTSLNKVDSLTQQETQRIKFSIPFLAEAIISDGKS